MKKNNKIEDLEQRYREAEAHEAQTKQTMRAIRKINRLIFHEENLQQLIRQSCAILTKIMGYPGVWIALLADNCLTATLTASAGLDGTFTELNERLKSGEFPNCILNALEHDGIVIVKNPKTECVDCRLSAELNGCTVLCRLSYEGKTYGILSASVPESDVFDEEEKTFLEEVADDLAFAVHKIETEQSLHDSQHDLKRAQSVAQIGSWRFDLNSGNVIASDEARRIYGLGDSEWEMKRVQAIPLPQYRDALDAELYNLIHKGKRYDIEFQICRPSDNAIRHIHSVAEYDSKLNIVIGTIQDITVRKEAESALRESEANLREAQRIVLMGRWERNHITNKLQWSDTIFDIFELDPETFEVNSDTFLEAVHPDDREMVYQAYTQSLIDNQPYNIEHRLLMSDGRVKWVNERCRTDHDEQGHPIRSVGIVQDITDRKETEEAQRQEQERLEFVIDGSNLGTWSWNVQTNETVFNETWAALIGYSLEELTPYNYETWERLVHPDDLPQAVEFLSRCVKGEIPDYECEFRMKHKDGHWVWILDRGRVMTHDAEGKPLSMFGTHTDITERMQAEEQLRRERERLSDIIIATKAGTWEWNIQTGETVFNERWAEIIGYTLEELLPVSIETWVKYAHPEDLKQSNELLERHFKGELDYYEFESRMKHKNGSWIWVLDRGKVSTWTDDGKPLMMSGNHQDITKRKMAEEALRKSEERNRLLSDVTMEGILIHKNGVAIDLNKSLSEMLGFDREKLLNTNLIKFVHEEDLATVRENITKPYSPPYTIRMIRKNGEYFLRKLNPAAFKRMVKCGG